MTGGLLALPVWTDYIKVAVAKRPESERSVPADLTRRDDDFVYPEYLAESCLDDQNAFIQSPFECGRIADDPKAGGPELS